MANPVTWFEVVGRDGAALRSFYSGLFGWQLQLIEEMNYGMLEGGNGGIDGGIGQAQERPGHVTFYASVDDPQASLDKAEQLGGKTVVPVTELEMVTFALFADPEGHMVGLVKAQER
jgi:predicted enzyme related to lactoylglutathione lyase